MPLRTRSRARPVTVASPSSKVPASGCAWLTWSLEEEDESPFVGLLKIEAE